MMKEKRMDRITLRDPNSFGRESVAVDDAGVTDGVSSFFPPTRAPRISMIINATICNSS